MPKDSVLGSLESIMSPSQDDNCKNSLKVNYLIQCAIIGFILFSLSCGLQHVHKSCICVGMILASKSTATCI